MSIWLKKESLLNNEVCIKASGGGGGDSNGYWRRTPNRTRNKANVVLDGYASQLCYNSHFIHLKKKQRLQYFCPGLILECGFVRFKSTFM